MAQERKKRRIVLASILKPVDDTRMYEKMGCTLWQNGDNEVTVIGFPKVQSSKFEVQSSEFKVQGSEFEVQGSEFKVQSSGFKVQSSGFGVQGSVAGVRCVELPKFRRISFGRFIAKWRVFANVLQLKPEVFIITTHELLLPAVLLKLFSKVKVVYDIRENYYRNIIHSGSFPVIIRSVLASVVRFKEKLLSPFVDHFLLAEKGYEIEFRFFKRSYTVVENKAMPLMPRSLPKGKEENRQSIKLLFSGTLAESTGVFRAIELAKELHKIDERVSLTIIGKASLKETLDKIRKEAGLHFFITLIGGDSLVAHHEINRAIAASDFGILSYPLLYHTKNSKPTKLFEYLNGGLPIILEKQWPWVEQYQKYEPFLLFDFSHPDYATLLQGLLTKSFYPSVPAEITWDYEEKAFLEAVLE